MARTRRSASYRRRRSPLLLILLVLAAVALIFFLFRRCDAPSQGEGPSAGEDVSSETLTQPEENVPEESTPALPALDEAPWELKLVNGDHPLPEDWTISTTQLLNGLYVDSRAYDALMAMLNDCKAAGLAPIVCSAYRTFERQTELFQAKIDDLMKDGLTYDEAYAAASEVVAVPGTSEHTLGLAVDICATDYQLLDDAQAETPEQKWLMEHCAEYGFILRYPLGKEELTGIIWEPWHYRYVGVEAAREIMDSGLCLEEYLAARYDGV